jgi:hypothetical protein
LIVVHFNVWVNTVDFQNVVAIEVGVATFGYGESAAVWSVQTAVRLLSD